MLRKGRTNCSACFLDDKIYVVGGSNMNSLERFDTLAEKGSESAQWKLINLPKQMYSARVWPAVCALNENEIVILGGRTKVSATDSNLSEISVLDTRTDKLRKASDDNIAFVSKYNQAAQVATDQVIVLADPSSNPDGNQDKSLSLISWTNGVTQLRKV